MFRYYSEIEFMISIQWNLILYILHDGKVFTILVRIWIKRYHETYRLLNNCLRSIASSNEFKVIPLHMKNNKNIFRTKRNCSKIQNMSNTLAWCQILWPNFWRNYISGWFFSRYDEYLIIDRTVFSVLRELHTSFYPSAIYTMWIITDRACINIGFLWWIWTK